MAKKKKKYWLVIGILVFLVYVFAAAQPIPPETILVPRWLTSLESGYPIKLGGSPGEDGVLNSFELGGRFGYFRDDGSFVINQVRKNYVSISEESWSEYEAVPSSLTIRDPNNGILKEIEDPQGYPFFLDGRTFILGKGQDSITAVGDRGEKLWTYDFPAPLTCAAAASGFVIAGTLDGTVELINPEGRQAVPSFEPGGSRLAVILGCAISSDASMLAIISGIDNQRFIMLEKSGDRYMVVYHEFLSAGLRRPLHVAFIDNDRRVVFEREDGAGIYEIASRTSVTVPIKGEIVSLDGSGTDGILFLVSSTAPDKKRFVAVRYPDTIFIDAPFSSESGFLGRRNSRIYLGGDPGLVSLELGKK